MHQRLRVVGRLSVEVGGVLTIFGLSEELRPTLFHKISKSDVGRVNDAIKLSNIQTESRWHELKHYDQQLKQALFQQMRKTYGGNYQSEIEDVIKRIEETERTNLPLDCLKVAHIGSANTVQEFREEYRALHKSDLKSHSYKNFFDQPKIELTNKPIAEGVSLLLKEWTNERSQLVGYFKVLSNFSKLQTELLQEELECSPDNAKDEMLASALRIGGSLGWLFITRNILFTQFPQRTVSIGVRPLIITVLGLTILKLTVLADMFHNLSFTKLALKRVNADIETEDMQSYVENHTESEREAKKAALELQEALIALPESRQRWLGTSKDDPYTWERRFIYESLPSFEYPLVFYFGLLRSLLGFVSPLTAHVVTAWVYAMVEEDRITPQRAQAELPILESMVSNASFSLASQLFFQLLTRPGTIFYPLIQLLITNSVFDWFRPKDIYINPFDYIQEDTPRYKKCIELVVKKISLLMKLFPALKWWSPEVSTEQWRRLRTAISSDIGGDPAVEKKLRAKDLFDLFCVHHSLILKRYNQDQKEGMVDFRKRVPWAFVCFLNQFPELQLNAELREKIWFTFLFGSFWRYLDLLNNENRVVNEEEFRSFFTVLQFCFEPVDFDTLITAIDSRDELSEEQGLDLVNEYFQAAVDEDDYVLENYEPALFEDSWRQRLAGRLPVTPPAKQTREAFKSTECGNMMIEIGRRFFVGGTRSERKFMLEHGLSPQKLKSVANQLSVKYSTIKPLEIEWIAYFQSFAQGERLLVKMNERDNEEYKKAVYKRILFTQLRLHMNMKLT